MKSPYQRNEEININFRTQFFRTTILYSIKMIFHKYNLKPVGAQLKSVTVPQFKIFLNNSYIVLLFVNFTTLPYFACTGEHLVKI